MSHKIRTPLNGVMAMLHVRKDGRWTLNRQVRSMAMTSRSGSLPLTDILDLSRIEADWIDIREEEFESAICALRAGTLLVASRVKGLSLETSLDPALRRLLGTSRAAPDPVNLIGQRHKIHRNGLRQS
jgi:signal transduction histidine kinase